QPRRLLAVLARELDLIFLERFLLGLGRALVLGLGLALLGLLILLALLGGAVEVVGIVQMLVPRFGRGPRVRRRVHESGNEIVLGLRLALNLRHASPQKCDRGPFASRCNSASAARPSRANSIR